MFSWDHSLAQVGIWKGCLFWGSALPMMWVTLGDFWPVTDL